MTTHLLEGEGFWADREKVRLVIKRNHTGVWEKWLLVPSSGGSVYRASEKSLLKAKEHLCAYAADFLKDVYGLESLEPISLAWHPIGPGGRFVLLLVDGDLCIEECNSGGEADCARSHHGTLLSAHDSKAEADDHCRLLMLGPAPEP
jgi:hypothetical protein